MSLFWDLRQDARISEVGNTAARAQSRATEAKSRVEAAERRAEKALLVCEALWCMVRSRLKLTDNDLMEMVRLIDESDGKLDGKVRRPAKTCPECGRNSPDRLAECLYCGAAMPTTPFSA